MTSAPADDSPAAGTPMVRVDRDRLWASLMELKEIGAYDDEATGLRGVRRLALTDADAEARRRCVAWMTEAGLEVRVDRIGNVYATRPGRDRSLPCVLMGSHIDTVATGGAFDGTLGVLGGIEVMRTLRDARIETLRDIEVGFFTEEEGVRFGTDMLGSAVTAGRIPLDHAHKLSDSDGKTVREELVRIGFDGPAPERRPVPYAYIECHIEQGPILADAGVDIGIVEGVQSISWQRLTVRGEAAHAGTTPIESRHDAGLVAASVVVELRRMCDSGDIGRLRATVGNFDIGAGQTNVIPHQATLTVDLLTDHVAASDVVITMGCGDACPVYPGKRYEDWKLPDPAGKNIDAIRPIRDEIDQRVVQLLADLIPGPATERCAKQSSIGSARR